MQWQLVPDRRTKVRESTVTCRPAPIGWKFEEAIALSFLELADEDCFGHANVFHPCDVGSSAQLHLKQDGLYAGQAGFLEDFFV